MKALLRKKRTLVVVDDYGIIEDRKWRAEVERFVETLLIRNPAFRRDVRFRVDQFEGRDALAAIVRDMVAECQSDADRSFVSLFNKAMSPTEYEHFCAARLKAAGWKAVVTKGSGDQGADVIATRGEETVIVQCKHYAKPVGNKAVQEAAAAMRHYNGDHAIVVATNGFTKAAQALAATNGVLLLDHDDLTADWRLTA